MDALLQNFVPKALYKDPPTLFRVAASGVLLYAVVLLFSRLHGTRTTSKMNNFDWLISVATGSIFGSAVVSDSVTVMQAVVAFATLFTLQWLLTKASAYSPWIYHTVTASPALLFHDGRFLDAKLKAERVTRDEVLSAVRGSGSKNLSEVAAVILEPDGKLTVLPGRGADSPELLRPVKYAAPDRDGGLPG